MPTLQWKKFVSKNAYVPKLQLNAEAELVSEEELKLNFQYLKGRKFKGNLGIQFYTYFPKAVVEVLVYKGGSDPIGD